MAAVLAMAGSAAGLLIPGIYAGLTSSFRPQALAQDLANLVVVSPALLALALLARRGSPRAFLLWTGAVGFTVYNYIIYCVSIPFGPLFLLWTAVLGLALFALIGAVGTADHERVRADYHDRMSLRVAGWVLLSLAVLFALLWLSEDIPALLAGREPASVRELGVPTNAVHVLDLGFFLPAAAATGVMLLRRRPAGYVLAPGMLAFLTLTGLPILLTPLMQQAIGQSPDWGIELPIGMLTLGLAGLLCRVIAAIDRGEIAPDACH